MKKIILLILISVFCGNSFAEESEFLELYYNGDILEVPIKTNTETRIVLGFVAEIGFDPSVGAKGVLTNILPSGIFITNSLAFEREYAEIREIGGLGRVIPVRFVSNDSDPNAATKIKIIDTTVKEEVAKKEIPQKVINRAKVRNILPSTGRNKKGNSIVKMIRFVSTSLFGAPRLQADDTNFKQVDTQHKRYRLFPGAKVRTTVLSSYEYNGLFITAIKVKNLSSYEYVIDPRTIVGHWLYAGMQDSTVIPGNGAGAIYLISSTQFDNAVNRVVNWRKFNG